MTGENYPILRAYGFTPPARGSAVLIDRLWPRGIAKETLANIPWEKDAAPSPALRRWLHEAPAAHYQEFAARYQCELQSAAARAALTRIRAMPAPTHLVTAVKNAGLSHLPTLRAALMEDDEGLGA